MIRTEFASALNQICSERGVEPEMVLEAIKIALLAAYKKDYGSSEDLRAEVDPDSGEAKIFNQDKDITPPGFGRIAAQTAKQVILQKVREAEKDAIISDFKRKVGQVASAMVQRFEGQNIILDLGRTTGIMPPPEQVETEKYRLNQRLKVLIKKIKEGQKGPEIIVSRSDKDLVKELFAIEVPEIHSGAAEVKAVAREAGSRSKVAVASNQDGVVPIGSCVGQKGVRVQAVTRELFDEKIDIITYSDNLEKFIAASLSPAHIVDIKIKKTQEKATVFVMEDQLSLAIGKEGQNVRLAAKLTGWKIDIKEVGKGVEKEEAEKEQEQEELELKKAGLSERIVNLLQKEGIKSVGMLKEKDPTDLKKIKGLGPKALKEIEKII